jgi:hypothetical protein
VVELAVETSGLGLTVTTTFIGVPGQPFAVGVTTYVTVPGVASVLVRVCAIVGPLDAEAPDIVPLTDPIVHEKVAPATLLLNGMFVVAPLQIVVIPPEVTFGVGLTVITTLTGKPEHPLAVGVTIYVTEPGAVPELINT